MRMEEGLDTGPMAMAERVADRRRHDGGRVARRAGAARRRPDGARARRAGARHVAAHAAAGRGRHLRGQDRQGRDAHRLGASRGKQVHDHCRGLSPFPGAWFELGGQRIKVLRTTRGEGSGAPGTVLDDRLTIACGDGAVRLTRSAARRQAADEGGGIPARREDRARNAAAVIDPAGALGRRCRDPGYSRCGVSEPAEADLVERLRRDGDLALALVADDGGRLHGYAAFAKLVVDDGERIASRRRARAPCRHARCDSGSASAAR